MRTSIVVAACGGLACTFSLAMLTWNWDAQGGCLFFPIGLGYLAFWFVPLMSYAFPKPTESKTISPDEWVFRKRSSWAVFIGGVLLTCWALSLPSPIKRKEDLRCYQRVLPYQSQPGCK
ncbi:MAG: hypothetical protein CBB60_007230 [Armatimonadetes bacterium Cent15-Ar3]|nr:MAG: hypothetical protein CBB60_007230 [Armatimonadetes bacterium Cent15-Ar3]